ncbi:MAG: SCO7613 C-terminal domain-containing membrane protein [Actinomycetes bacterium]
MTVPCPRCEAPIDEAAPGPVVICGGCGLSIATEFVREVAQLTSWRASADQRLAWLHGQMLAQSQPSGTTPTVATLPTGHAALAPQQEPPRPPASAGALLLAVGAFLLVIAGIAFLAFTWDLLGPFGQISVLLAIGAGCLFCTDRLAERLCGTAVSIGIVGVFLVSIAALGARFLGPDRIGELASVFTAIGILLGLCAAGRWLRPRVAPVGELAGVSAAVLTVALVNTAPADGAIPLDEPWAWWVALCSRSAAVVLFILAKHKKMRSWPWVAAMYLVIGSVALGAWAAESVHHLDAANAESLAFATVVAAASGALSLGLRRVIKHRAALMSAVLVAWSLALIVAWTVAVAAGASRGWSALVLVAIGAIALIPGLLGTRQGAQGTALTVAGSVAVASAVGVAIPPYVRATADMEPPVWAAQVWPAWRGLVAGLAFVAVLVVTSLLTARATERLRDEWVVQLLPLATTAAALATWLVTVETDRDLVTKPSDPFFGVPAPTPDALTEQVAVALGLVAIGILAMALLRRVPAWSGWLVPVLGIPAELLALSTRTLTSQVAPEVIGVAIAVPALFASLTWWWLRRPEPTPTWQTIAPPFVLAVLPSTLALLQDTNQRWWFDEDPGTDYQVRMVGLIAVAAGAAVLGARQRWSGLFFPGLFLAVVVAAVEVIDLGRFLPQWLSFGVAGVLLIAAGARWEWLRQRGRVSAAWVRTLR